MYLVARYYRGIEIGSMRLLPNMDAVFQWLEKMRPNYYSMGEYISRGSSHRIYYFEHPEAPPKLITKKKLLKMYREI